MRKCDWIDQFNINIITFADRPDLMGDAETVYVVKDIFTTRDGSWDPGKSEPGAVVQWARDTYLRPMGAADYFDDAGADHHMFSRLENADGTFVREAEMVYWSDGLAKLDDPNYNGYVNLKTKERSGWGNVVLSPGANYVPARGESGPWSLKVKGGSEIVTGMGMPQHWHVSFFVVFQAVPRSQFEGTEPSTPEILPGVEDVIDTVEESITDVVAEIGEDATTLLGTETYPDGIPGIRQKAWDTVGVNYNPEAAFSRYAREHGLGIPLTNEFDVHNFRCQGFVGGIVYAVIGDWANVQHAEW